MAKETWADEAGAAKAERRAPDPELAAMRRILAILEELPPAGRRRVAIFVIDRATAQASPGGMRITELE